MRTNRKCTISSLNTLTMRSEWKMGELEASAKKTMQDIICIQEYRLIHDDTHIKEHANENWKLLTCSTWKNSINTTTGGVGMLLSPLAYDALENVKRISTRIMIANLQGNPGTTVISCYSPTNVIDENETAHLYTELSVLTRSIPRHIIIVLRL